MPSNITTSHVVEMSQPLKSITPIDDTILTKLIESSDIQFTCDSPTSFTDDDGLKRNATSHVTSDFTNTTNRDNRAAMSDDYPM